ncbi:MAG TPA: J domain-containing protein [Acidimicrobiales bacterium]|nr:J domain-containing protein [Acidimicrobiales bacterium]
MDDPRSVLGVGPDASGAEVRRARRRLAKELHPDLQDPRLRPEAERRMALVNQAYDLLVAAPPPAPPPPPPVVEEAAFAIDALPVDAFEATLMAAVNLGDVIRAEEPYLLAVLLDHPAPCQCLLELAPDAGATTVSIDVAPRHFGTCPSPEAVRDAFVAEIRRQSHSAGET